MPAEPPAPPAGKEAHLDDRYLVRARLLLERAIRSRWAQGLLTQDQDGVFTSFLGSQDVERLFRPPAAGAAPPLPDDSYPADTPIGQLAQRLRLLPSQIDLLAVLLSAEVDPACARLLTYLGGNQAQFQFTVDLLFDIVYRGRGESVNAAAALLHRDLAQNGWLRRQRFVLIDGAESRSVLAQTVRLHPRIARWLLGAHDIDADLGALCTLYPPIDPPFGPAGECEPQALALATCALAAGGRLLLIEGPIKSGREMLLHFAAARLHLPALVVSGLGLGPDRLVAAFREAFLHGALLAFRDPREVLEGESLLRFRESLEVFPGTVAFIGGERLAPLLLSLRPTSTVKVQVPPHGQRLRLWRQHLGEEADLSEAELERTSSLYNLGISGIVTASHSARELARFSGQRVRHEHVVQTVRQLFDADLSTVATRYEISQTWDDLVLPEDVSESIAGLLDRIRLRGEVLGEWGFARKLGKGLGVLALFSGEPGTGKSMVASLIAREMGLELYVVDLSRVTSKWLGETEKNLSRAFDAAEAGHVLLLFDEADTILGKRSSDVRSSNDRYANMETNFVLARLEQFQGIAVFTTNMPSAIDPAMLRRMSVHITFPFPDVPTRAELWARMIPAEAPLAGAIDFERLAERYELTGGFIRNVVLRAAYAAARDQAGLTTDYLEQAAHLEYRERGSLIVGGRLS